MTGLAAFPGAVLIDEEVLLSLMRRSLLRYRSQGTEWGYLLWGEILDEPPIGAPDIGTVPLIRLATEGVCRATPTTCEILPASWELARQELEGLSMTGSTDVGDAHSHPFGGSRSIFLSEFADVPSFWAHQSLHWISIVVDPLSDDSGAFANGGSRIERVPLIAISTAEAAELAHGFGRAALNPLSHTPAPHIRARQIGRPW